MLHRFSEQKGSDIMQDILIDRKYLNPLSRVFSPIVIDSLAEEGTSKYLNEVCQYSGIMKYVNSSEPFSSFIEIIYNLLAKQFRNEYVFKNEIARKLFLRKHNIHTATLLTEFRVASCKADIAIFNDTSTVYEIKTDFDSHIRLDSQLNSYLQFFDYIYVVGTPDQEEKLTSLLPAKVGLITLTEKKAISTVRKASSNKTSIKHSALFDSLRKREYLEVTQRYYGEVPDVPNTQIYRVCKELFCQIPLNAAHTLTINVLKKRTNSVILSEMLSRFPGALTAYLLSVSNDRRKIQSLLDILDNNIGCVIG